MADNSPTPELAAAIKATEAKYKDLPPGVLEKMAGIESQGGRNLTNPNSSARGPFQFMASTGPEFGLMTEADRMDVNKSTDAAARLLLRNKKDLEKQLGRSVSPGELYLAHQQGATGAARILKDPNARAVDVLGADQVKLNLPPSMRDKADSLTTGDFAKLWTSKIDGGGGQAPAKKPEQAQQAQQVKLGAGGIGDISTLNGLKGVPSEASFYTFDPKSIGALQREASQLDKIRPVEPTKIDSSLTDVPDTKIGSVRELARGNPEQQASALASPGDSPRDKTGTAILQGLSTLQKTAERVVPALAQIEAVDDTQTAPSGIPGQFSKGIEAGLQNTNADFQYFGAIIDSITGDKTKMQSRIFNAQQYEADSARALAGMQSFEEFLKEPSVDGFISQVVSSAGQVAPSALESIASALTTGGLYTLGKTTLSAGAKTVAKTLVKDMLKKQAKGEVLDSAEKGVLQGLYDNFKHGAVAGAFGQEYVTMSGEAFKEFGEAGVELDANRGVQSLLLGIPQAAVGVGGEYAIVETLGKLALKKSTRIAGDSVLKRFAADVLRTAAKSGALEGTTEAVQESISTIQRASVDPTFTLEDAQLRIGQAAFAGFFGGGTFGGGAAIPSAAMSSVNMKTVGDKARDLLKGASEARVETEVDQDTKGVNDGAVTGATTPEDAESLNAQMELMLSGNTAKKAVWISDEQDTMETDAAPGKVTSYTLGEESGVHAGKKIYVGHIPGRGKIVSTDQSIVDGVMSEYELGGDVDAATGEALGYVGGKDGEDVVRVKDADGNVLHEQVANDETLPAARARASEVADAVPGAVVDEPTIETAMEERAQKAHLDKKEFTDEAAVLRAIRDQLGAYSGEPDANPEQTTEDLTAPVDVDGKKYSRAEAPVKSGASVEEITQRANKEFAGVKHLFGKGVLRVEQKPGKGVDPSARAVTDIAYDTVTIYADNVAPDEVRGVMLHELGAHQGLRKILSREDIDQLLRDIQTRVEGPSHDQAEEDVRTEGKRFAKLTSQPTDIQDVISGMRVEDRTTNGYDLKTEEILGHLLEHLASGKRDNIVQRLITKIKLWLRKHAPKLFQDTPLTDKEILLLAEAAVRREIKDAKAQKEVTPKTLGEKDKIKGKGNPDYAGFITSAEKAIAEPAPRWRDAKRLSPAQWRKLFKESGATKEAFKYQIEPALQDLADKGETITRDAMIGALHNNRVGLTEHDSQYNKNLYEQYITPGEYKNYKQKIFTVSPEAMRRFLGELVYRSHNWGATKNPVFHYRTTERVTTSGEEILFNDEMQSDIKQEEVKHGSKELGSPEIVSEAKTEEIRRKHRNASDRLAEYVKTFYKEGEAPSAPIILNDVSNDAYYVGWNDERPTIDGKMLNEDEHQKFTELWHAYNNSYEELKAVSRGPQDERVPKLPMDQWEGPVIERILLDGLRAGKKLIAFTSYETLNRALKHEGTKKFYNVRQPRTIMRVAQRIGAEIEMVDILAGNVLRSAESIYSTIDIESHRDANFGTEWTATYDPHMDGDPASRTDVPGTFATAEEVRAAARKEIDRVVEQATLSATKTVIGVRLTPEAEKNLQSGVVMYSRPADETTTRKMILDDEGEPVSDAADTEADITAMEDQLAKHYAEIDGKKAKKRGTFNERVKKADPEEEAAAEKNISAKFLRLAQYTPDAEQFKQYESFKDRMPPSMVDKLLELNRINDSDLGMAHYDVMEDGDGKLSIVERTESTDPETEATREAVRDTLKQVRRMGKDGFNGTLHMVEEGGETVIRPARASMFWLVNRYTKQAMRLNGTAKTKTKKGRTGLQALTQAGVALSAKTGQWVQGDGMTERQKNSQGLMTMLKALIDAGYDLKVGKYPNALVDYDARKLDPIAKKEVAMVVGGRVFGINELLGVKAPLDLTKSTQPTQRPPNEHNVEIGPNGKERMKGPDRLDSPDPNDVREELSPDTETQTPLISSREELGRSQRTVQSTIANAKYPTVPASNSAVASMVSKRGVPDFNNPMEVSITPDGERNVQVVEQGDARRVSEGTQRRVLADQGEQFALQEDKKKNINDVERDDAAAEAAARRENVDNIVRGVIDEFGRGPRGAAELVSLLGPVPEDVTISVKKENGKFVATVTSPRFTDRKVPPTKNKEWALARAHAIAVAQSDALPVMYNKFSLESLFTTVKSRSERVETGETGGKFDPNKKVDVTQTSSFKDQTSAVNEPGSTIEPSANKIKTFGRIGDLTNRVLGIASSKFNFHRPTVVMTLKHLVDNFDELTGQGGKYARVRDTLSASIEEMMADGAQEPAHVLMGRENLIILRDEFTTEQKVIPDTDPNAPVGRERTVPLAEDPRNADDAEIAAVLAHEIGHIVFQQEYDSMIDGTPLKNALWDAYIKHRRAMEAENGKTPGQYTKDKAGFEEWYADQVMAYVYKESNAVKGIVDGYFKRVAKALKAFFTEVNARLRDRLKLSRVPIQGIKRQVKTGKDKGAFREGGTFADYMEQVVARNKRERENNNTFPVEDQIRVKKMALNIQARLPAGAQRTIQNVNAHIMRTGSMKKLTHGLLNIVNASTDFMKLSEHGPGGKALSNFFGTYSQSMEKLGWNKRELFMQNRWNNELSKIFGFDDRTNPNEWDSPRTRSIMIEAMDEDKTYAQLSTPEAKQIRDLYTKIEQTYLKRPGSNRYYIPEFRPRANYGGPRMWNVDKIANNKAEFIAWLGSRIQGDPEIVWQQITRHTQDPVKSILARVDNDINNAVAAGQPQATPAQRAAMAWRMSTEDSAVTEMRDKVLRDARRGVYNIADVTAELLRQDPTNTELTALAARPAAEHFAGLKRHWLKTTRKLRLTPGMDPALRRTLAPDVKTTDAYAADPNDENGWLLPPALAHAQYMHYIARRVEFERMGRERGGLTGVDYILEQLDQVPEEYRDQVDEAIMANLGKFGENMSNKWRAVNSVAAVWTVFTTLLFTTLSSVTDLAGIMTRSKDIGALDTFIKGMKTTLTDREFQELARSVGVVTGRTQEHMMIGQGELDYANKTARSLMNGFFRYTGLEFYTKFTRSLAVGMGREFIINTALKQDFGVREERYLAELGLTRDDVRNWLDQYQMFDTPHGEKVRTAIARFADEAVIRPDASQRPTWASNPYLQMVWQLKSYYYGFGKTVLGGLGREIKNRYTEDGNFNGAAASMMLYATTIIPLTMFGMASRDWLKYLFQLAIPGLPETASTSMKLDSVGYMWEIVKRSGTLGPFALGLTTMEAFKFEGIAAPFTANVPMFDLFDDTIFDGDLTRPLPVINNVK